MKFPEWSPQLESELRAAYHNSNPIVPPFGSTGASRHGGIKAVYDRLRELAQEEGNPNRVIVEFDNESDAEKFREEVRSPFGLPIEWHTADEVIHARLVEEDSE